MTDLDFLRFLVECGWPLRVKGPDRPRHLSDVEAYLAYPDGSKTLIYPLHMNGDNRGSLIAWIVAHLEHLGVRRYIPAPLSPNIDKPYMVSIMATPSADGVYVVFGEAEAPGELEALKEAVVVMEKRRKEIKA